MFVYQRERQTRSAPSPACGGGVGRGSVCTESFCVPPPYPSPPSGGGGAPSARAGSATHHEHALQTRRRAMPTNAKIRWLIAALTLTARALGFVPPLGP